MTPLGKIKNHLHLKGRDGVILLMSLLVSFVIWLASNLSRSYSGNISVPVIAESNIYGHSRESSAPTTVIARCHTSGYSLLRNSYRRGHKVSKVKIDNQDLHHLSGDRFFISGPSLNAYSDHFFGEGTTVDAFISDTLFFIFPSVNHKKVPVELVHNISFRPEYMSAAPIKVEPDSVVLYGEQSRIEDIEHVSTSPLDLYDIHETETGTLRLGKIKGVEMSAEEVHYTITTSRYVELKTTVQIEVFNCPSGKMLSVYPSSAEVVLRCTFPVSRDPSESFRLYVDYNEFASSINGRCIPRAVTLPPGVIDYNIIPEVFDCILSE